MAPEMFEGEPGDEATDIYALGVTVFRAFTGEFPFGNLNAESRSRLERPKDLSVLRPDLPAWLHETIGRALAREPTDRFSDAGGFIEEMEAGPGREAVVDRRPPTLYERYPLRFWQALSALLAIALAVLLWRRWLT